jgi:hypothetical protein
MDGGDDNLGVVGGVIVVASFVFFAKKHRRFILCFRGLLDIRGISDRTAICMLK